MKRKVLILTAWYPNALSPVSGVFIQDQALAMSREHDVAVLAPILIPWYKFFRRARDNKKQMIDVTYRLSVLQKEVSLIPGMRYFYELWASYYYRQVMRGFEELATSWGWPDVIHAHVVLPAGWAALQLARVQKIPVVLTEHSGPFASQLRSPSTRRLVKETLEGVDFISAVSPALKERMQAFCPQLDIRVIGNVVDEDFFFPEAQPTVPTGPFRFLSIALLNRQKGMEDLIKAARLVASHGTREFEVVIGGDGPARRDLETLVKEAGLSRYVRFTGLLSRLEVRDWIRKCDAFVLPSLGETFGVVLAEAMACGKPVIATRCGGPEFIVTPETGVLVDIASPAQLATAMGEFLKGSRVFDSRAIRNSITARFGQAAFIKQISNVYDSLL